MAKGSGGTRISMKVITEMSVSKQEKLASKMNMTDEERKAIYENRTRFINSFTGFAINRHFNKGGLIKDLSEEQKDAVKALDDVIEKNTIPSAINAFRFETPTYPTFEKEVAELKVGSTFTRKGFTHLSMNHERSVAPLFNNGLVINVNIPKGHHALITSNIKESEIILGRNTTYKVVKVHEYKGVKAVDVEIVRK